MRRIVFTIFFLAAALSIQAQKKPSFKAAELVLKWIKNYAKGVQFAGFSNHIGQYAEGFMFAGFMNTYGKAKGMQFAGFTNIALKDVEGAQFAGFMNKAADLDGIQIAGFSNVAKKVTGSQFAGFSNISGDIKGSQFAGFTNTAGDVEGSQFAGFINNAKKAGHVEQDYPTPFAHTPSFDGSHTTGWDNMFEGTIRYFTLNHMDDKKVGSNGKINLVPGFETYVGNFRVMHRMMKEMGVD